MLTQGERQFLVAVARHALKEEVCGVSCPAPEPLATPAMSQTVGAFVTLNKGGELRGCLGLLSSDMALPVTIDMMARRAATEDPRFDPVSPDEVEDLTVELSILSPFHPITAAADVTIGRDGLLIQRGSRRGLLLPQVAERYHFTPEEFLEETCLKAGLPRHAWKDEGTDLQAFSAEVIEEGEP
jgi:AmmeMemoRadiSam system protein A